MRTILPPRTSTRNSASSTPRRKRLVKNLPITGRIRSSLTWRAQRSIHSRSKLFLLPYLLMQSSCGFGRSYRLISGRERRAGGPVDRGEGGCVDGDRQDGGREG